MQALPERMLENVARQLPVLPRSFAIAARSDRRLRDAVDLIRLEVGQRAAAADSRIQDCLEQGLQSAGAEAAGELLAELAFEQETQLVLELAVMRAPVHAPDDMGRTALMWAIEKEDTELMEALVGAVGNLDQVDEDNQTALTLAVSKGQTEIVKALIGGGASVELNKPLMAANHKDTTELLIAARARLDITMPYSPGQTKLHMTALSGNTEVADALIAAGLEVNLQDEGGTTALMLAVMGGSTEVAKALIGARADLDMQDKDGRSALMYIAGKMIFDEAAQEETAKVLIRAGAELDLQSVHGTTVLHLAAGQCRTELVQALIVAGARVDLQDNEGWAALQHCYKNRFQGYKETAEVLKAAGAE